MDLLSFGIGAVVGVAVDHVIDNVSRRFWSDERQALFVAHKEQQGALLREEAHVRKLQRLADKALQIRKDLKTAQGEKALILEAKLASVLAVHDRVEADGPHPKPAPAKKKKAAAAAA